MRLLPRSLFGRAALLIALTLLGYSVLVWQAMMWAIVVPGAETQAELLTMRANEAIGAQRNGRPLPANASIAPGAPVDVSAHLGAYAYGVYLRRLRGELQRQLHTQEVVIARSRAPAEIWIRTAESAPSWLVLTNRVATPVAPAAFTVVLILSALLVLAAAAWWARRLTTPLAQLAREAIAVAEGEPMHACDASAPSEVRALAIALQSMSQRVTELNEQRELVLAGISHDLRSPLARLRVALELLDAREASLAQSMALDIEEMDRMIGQFLQYVRAGYRETPVRAAPDEIVRESLKAFLQDQRLAWQLQAEEICVLRTEGLRHIVLNLVQNALDHGAPPVTVSTRLEGHALQLAVRDQGQGIAEREWTGALRAFDRLGAAPNAGHSGLGLALVDRLVRSAGGTLAARRDPDSFVISVQLPVA